MGKIGTIVLSIALWIGAGADAMADEVLSSSEFSVINSVEEVIINEDLIVKSTWIQPYFLEPNEPAERQLANTANLEPLGQLRLMQEIPHSYPWLTHKVLQQQVLSKLEHRGKAKK